VRNFFTYQNQPTDFSQTSAKSCKKKILPILFLFLESKKEKLKPIGFLKKKLYFCKTLNFKKMYIDNYRNTLAQLCAQNKVKSLYAFGSVLTSRFDNDSDIDLIVDIDSGNPLEYADNYFNLKFALQDLFNRPVDLLEDKAIRNDYLRKKIDNSKQLIYAG
jgi:predicted nucleotidyltransferase